MFHNPLEGPSLSTARSSYRPAVEVLESRMVPAAITPAVILIAQEVAAEFHDLVSLEQHPTGSEARAVLGDDRRQESQHLLAHSLDQFFTAQGVNDAPFQQLDDLFHALSSQVVAQSQRVLGGR